MDYMAGILGRLTPYDCTLLAISGVQQELDDAAQLRGDPDFQPCVDPSWLSTFRDHGHHWIRDEKRYAIYARDKKRCAWCGARRSQERQLSLDHIIPVRHGGTHATNNLVTACVPCNRTRGNTPFLEWASKFPGSAARVCLLLATPINRAVGRKQWKTARRKSRP